MMMPDAASYKPLRGFAAYCSGDPLPPAGPRCCPCFTDCAVSQIQLEGHLEIWTSSSVTSKANCYATAFAVTNWETEAKLVQDVLQGWRRKDLSRSALARAGVIEAAVTAGFAQSTSCKATQRILAAYSVVNMTRLRRKSRWLVPRMFDFRRIKGQKPTRGNANVAKVAKKLKRKRLKG